ncbi:MAG: NAD(P)H-binding protein [bacterium]
MRIAITGGTGFIGRHLGGEINKGKGLNGIAEFLISPPLARDLAQRGHQVVLIARGLDRRDTGVRDLSNITFISASIDNEAQLLQAFAGCHAVAHCAGINREIGTQTYQRLHVDGTRGVISAAQKAAVSKLVLVSYLHARPRCQSPYHETKWAAEELVRASGLDYTILKVGLIYGFGDHLLTNLSQLLRRVPVFATVGLREQTVRPIAVEDLVTILRAALVEGRLSRQTVAVVGPEELAFSIVARRIAQAMHKRIVVLPFPVLVQRWLAWLSERVLPAPVVTVSQIRMLAEGISVPLADSQALPDDLKPVTRFTEEQIRKGLPGQCH